MLGDTHLAMFRVSKLEKVEAASKPEESEDKVESDNPPEATETSWNWAYDCKIYS